MPQYSSYAIAAVFALLGFLPLAGRGVRRPLLWACLVAGAIAGFFAREATKLAVEALAPYTAVATGTASIIVALVIAAVVGELLKAMAPLAATIVTPTDAPTALGYGAAAGAGFGFVIAQQGLAMALGLVGSPFITPTSTVIAVAGWYFRILPQIVTTALVGRAAVRGGLGWVLLLAVALQVGLALVERLPLLAGIPMGLLVAALVSVALYIYLWGLRSGSPAAARP